VIPCSFQNHKTEEFIMPGGGYDLDEIRRRADLVEIISPHVALRKAGRRLGGLCPFHQERTPSFTVDPEKGVWHCFGCKAGGDVFTFVELMEKVTFTEAAELLARRYGIAPQTPDGGARQRQKERLLALHEQAAEFFREWLELQSARPARAYLKKRGLSDKIIRDFGIGYAPEGWETLLAAMTKRGYTAQELATAGLVVAREDRHYDRFRERIIFPIWDSSGRVIAFGGRSMRDDNPPKYLNSPETALFQKGRVLYAFDRARKAVDGAGRAIIVEGYLDAIACHEAGFTETVATMGTALTPEHVDMLRRRAPQLVLSFDSDSAGMAAALRGRELFQNAGVTVRVVTLPGKTDPDELIRSQGREAYGKLLEEAVPIVEWELGRLLAQSVGLEEHKRLEGFRDAVTALGRVPPGVEREYYTRWLAQSWAPDNAGQAATMETAVREELARLAARRQPESRRTQETASEGVSRPTPTKPVVDHVEANLLAALLQHGRLAAQYAGQLEPEDFADPQDRLVFTAIRDLVEREERVTTQAVMGVVEPSAQGHLAAMIMREIPPERVQELMERGVSRLTERRLTQRHRALLQRFGEVGPGSEQEALQQELNECAQRLSQLRGRRVVGEL
jgi:DNA primase